VNASLWGEDLGGSGESFDASDDRQIDPFGAAVVVFEYRHRLLVKDEDKIGVRDIDMPAVGEMEAEGTERRMAQELAEFVRYHGAIIAMPSIGSPSVNGAFGDRDRAAGVDGELL
jgi:hypothetical protein